MIHGGMPDLSIPGPNGRLDARYTEADDPSAPVVLVLPPDPRFGATLNNRVTLASHRAFQDRGFTVMRISYRNTGQQSLRRPVEEDTSEIGDAAAALNYLQEHRPLADSTWVTGYSFGAWVAFQLLMRRPETRGFVAISPAVNLYDFSFVSPCPVSGLVISGRADKTVPKQQMREFINRLKTSEHRTITHRIIPKADHFYSEGLETLEAAIFRFLTKSRVQSKGA